MQRTIEHATGLASASVMAVLALVSFLTMTLPAARSDAASHGDQPGFVLIDQQGKRITARELGAKPSVVHFGYTRCPAICPTTLYEVSARMRDLGDVADRINFVFVTVDPDHDTPAVLAQYVGSFDPRIIALSGAPDQIAALAQELGASYSRVDGADGEYSMEHSVAAYLVAPGWRPITTLYMGVDASERRVLEALRELALASPRARACCNGIPGGLAWLSAAAAPPPPPAAVLAVAVPALVLLSAVESASARRAAS